MNRADYLQECMSDFPTTPLDAFNMTWCVRCPNSTCSRSAASNHLFVHRANGWKDALFNKVRRASEDDPAFANVRGRAFIGKEPDGRVETREPAVEEPRFFQPLSIEGEGEEEGELEVEDEPPDTDREPVLRQIDPPVPTVALNTPFVQGTVLPGGPTEKTSGEGQTTYTFGEEDE